MTECLFPRYMCRVAALQFHYTWYNDNKRLWILNQHATSPDWWPVPFPSPSRRRCRHCCTQCRSCGTSRWPPRMHLWEIHSTNSTAFQLVTVLYGNSREGWCESHLYDLNPSPPQSDWLSPSDAGVFKFSPKLDRSDLNSIIFGSRDNLHSYIFPE